MRRVILAIVLALVVLAGRTPAQQAAPPAPRAFAREDLMIPMRDGVRLHTIVFRPRDVDGPLPFLFTRTPYGCEGMNRTLEADATHPLYRGGYLVACQDIRGKFQSEGAFVMQRPTRDRRDPKAIDEGTDAYDTIAWLVSHVPANNGRVGMLGTSYPGWLTVMAMLDPHPALKAVAPMASPADMWKGDDFHHNGAFRLSYGFEYATMMESSKENAKFVFDRADTFEWYLRVGPLANINRQYLHEGTPTWNDFVAHPDDDAFWQRQTMVPQLTRVTVPTLSIAGWWDQEDFYGPVTIYQALERHDTDHRNFLVVGPWNHGGWNAAEGRRLGPIDFGSDVSKDFRATVLAPWFAHYLKDVETRPQPEALTFEAGANQWRTWDRWPPAAGVTPRNLYVRADRRLAFEPPADAGEAFDSYLSDPANPVPYRRRPIQPTYGEGSTWSTWLTEDQRFVDRRPDVATWETDTLVADVTIAGAITAKLFASTTGTDADWIVKLIDVYPEQVPDAPAMAGYQFMVANEVFRGRYRRSVERPEAIPANQVVPYTIDLHTQSYRFLKGHRIMVQVQSTWFPLIDRNPQTFVPNIFAARAADFRTATHRIFRSAAAASHIVLPVVDR